MAPGVLEAALHDARDSSHEFVMSLTACEVRHVLIAVDRNIAA
jgi:hypothetical protein